MPIKFQSLSYLSKLYVVFNYFKNNILTSEGDYD